MVLPLMVTALSTAAFGEGTDELWEVTVKMEMAGMPSMPARTTQVCQKKGERDPSKLASKDASSDCKVTDMKQAGNRTTWKMACTKPEAMTGSGDITYSGDSYQGTMTMSAKGMDMTNTMSGKKVGTCTYEEPAKKIEALQAQSKAAIAKECDKQIEELNPLMVFGGANLPEQSLLCKDRKADFCARSTKLAQQMRDPTAYSDANRKYPAWRDAMKQCGTDPATISGPVCKSAIDKKDWTFVTGNCPDEGRALAVQNCAGLDYTAAMASPYREICQKYGADLAKKKVADDKANAAQTPATTPATPSKPSVSDSVKEGAKSLKKLLNF
ncbi:MAG: DUF3617 family protein [Nibricoccus sp.]